MSVVKSMKARLSWRTLRERLLAQANLAGAARLLAILATVWFALAAAWGLAALPGGGHIGAGAAGTAMMAEQMLRWGIGYPAFGWYASSPPAVSEYYCHHPFGMYWASAVVQWLFGHRDLVVYLPAVAMSAASVPLAYAVARRWGGPPAGAIAALGFVAVPLNVGYANFHNLEVMCIFGALLFFWGHMRYQETGRFRDLGLSLGGVFVCTSADWAGYLIVAPVLAWALLRAFLLPRRWAPPIDVERFSRWWALSVALSVAAALLWVLVFAKAGKLGDWLASAEVRGGADLSSVGLALTQRRSWIDFSFTPLGVLVGKLCAVVSLIRLLVTRRETDSYPLALLLAAAVQYVAFKRGADVHIYWPHYFGAYFALALAHTASGLGGFVCWAVRRFRPERAALAGTVTLGVVGLIPPLLMLPDSVRALSIFRATGGRYNDKGTLIRTHRDMLTVLRDVVRRRLPHGSSVLAHGSATWGWEHYWAAEAPSRSSSALPAPAPAAADPIWIGRASGMSADFQKQLALAAHVRIYGDVWLVDRREPSAPLDAYAMLEHEPRGFSWLIYGALEPRYEIAARPDPFATWEWRTHLGVPSPAPNAEPGTPNELRIAHNAAIESGDATRTSALRQKIDRSLEPGPKTSFSNGVTLLGVRRIGGVQPRLELWFEATGPLPDGRFEVHSRVVRAATWSLIPADPVERRMAWPPSLPPALWRPGQLYTQSFVLYHRIGVEHYTGRWFGRDRASTPSRLDGRPSTLLLELN